MGLPVYASARGIPDLAISLLPAHREATLHRVQRPHYGALLRVYRTSVFVDMR